eukprot:4531811-Alexandrium_andersonii.AAC.1
MPSALLVDPVKRRQDPTFSRSSYSPLKKEVENYIERVVPRRERRGKSGQVHSRGVALTIPTSLRVDFHRRAD